MTELSNFSCFVIIFFVTVRPNKSYHVIQNKLIRNDRMFRISSHHLKIRVRHDAGIFIKLKSGFRLYRDFP
ncbi:hypothetical protein NADRNF5_1496 [Nitrosopumilus adriaticus]|uniref:Uncharacterized protein n=1 Tax=Nitrosopumilus adriaticus TaxID=1580092 RepID=A0A0D5C446_9ARCH|nr:hypothetical protein NADRNF5_1496 [Nitrosopumilus adriaticus]